MKKRGLEFDNFLKIVKFYNLFHPLGFHCFAKKAAQMKTPLKRPCGIKTRAFCQNTVKKTVFFTFPMLIRCYNLHEKL